MNKTHPVYLSDTDSLLERLRAGGGEEQEAAARIVALEAENAALRARAEEAETCGLCGERPTEENRIFICCENCTDIGASRVPKEVFELQRKFRTAKANADVLAQRLVESDDELKSANARAEAAEAQAAELEAALKRCDVSMDTAAMHGLPQQLPPAYRDSWALSHTTTRAVLERIENAAIEKGAEALPYIIAEAQTALEAAALQGGKEDK